jgi:hypothetical protein
MQLHPLLEITMWQAVVEVDRLLVPAVVTAQQVLLLSKFLTQEQQHFQPVLRKQIQRLAGLRPTSLQPLALVIL